MFMIAFNIFSHKNVLQSQNDGFLDFVSNIGIDENNIPALLGNN